MPLSPEDRKQLLAEIGRGKQKGALKTQASVDAYVAERTGGAVQSLEDLIPSAPEMSLGQHALAGAKLFGQGALGMGEIAAKAAAPTLPLGEAGQQVMGALPQAAVNVAPSTGAPLIGPLLASLGQKMGMKTHAPSPLEAAGGGLTAMAPEMAPWLQLLAGPAIGASQAPPGQEIEGGVAGGMGGASAAALPPVAGMAGKVGTLMANPSEAAGASAVMRTTLPASGGVAGIRNAMSQYGPSVSGANPMLAEYSRAGMEGLSEAASKSPELWNYLKTVFEKRGKIGSIADAIEAKRNTEVGPKLDEFKADPTPMKMETVPYTVSQAEHNPAAAQALREAMKNGWKPKISPNGVVTDEPIPGSSGGAWIATDPNILDAAKQLPKGGVPHGTPNPDIMAGEPPTQGQAFAIRKILDRKITAAKGLETQQDLIATRNRLDAELRAQSPLYADLMQQWATPTKLAEQYRAHVGEFKLPQSPGALGGHTPLGLNPTSLITRPGVFNFLDAWRRSKAQSAGAVLASQASGTPLTIEQVLQSLGSK